MSDSKIRIGITQGDVNGIGYEVIIKTLCDPRMCELCTPIVYGSAKAASFYKKQIDAAENFGFSTVVSAREAAPKRISLVDCVSGDLRVEPGVLSAAAGEASVAALRAAAADLKAGLIDAVVTAPICKENVQGEAFRFTGHTEFFASEFGVGWVFVANLAASVVTWLAILGTADRTVPKINWALLAAIVVVGAVVAAYASGTANNKEPQVQVTPTPEPTQIPTPTPTATPDPTPSPTPKGPRYVVYAENVSWTQAQQRCEELGGTLAVPLTEDEYNEIVRVCTSAKCNYVWLGAERQADGNWRDTNGEIITFFRWDEGEPSGIDIGDNAPENFLMMWRREDGWYYNDSRENPLLDFYAFYGDNVGFVCQMW